MSDLSVDKNLIQEISGLAYDVKTRSLAESYGLKVTQISLEDAARSKDSFLGPNISDMTLCVELRRDGSTRDTQIKMPVIRKPNFADVTADRPIENFTVTVGNESNSELKTISFKDFCENIQKYTNNPNIKAMLTERDTQILSSSQACILPLHDGEVEFCVSLYNYQSYLDDPAVLVIMSSSQGTSVQIANGSQQLYLNQGGTAYSLKAKRLSDDRKERGVPLDGPMTVDEKNRNALFIYQIPLKQKPKPVITYFTDKPVITYFAGKPVPVPASSAGFYDDYGLCLETCAPKQTVKRNVRGFDKAVISKGCPKGKFDGTKDLVLERDERFPIRCTIQYYNVTDEPTVSETQIKEISELISKVYDTATDTGSLVFSTSKRITEPDLMPTTIQPHVESTNTLATFL